MRKIIILTVAMLFCATTADAKKAPAKPAKAPEDAVWAQEPATFLGFTLGEPLPSSIPDCPRNAYGTDDMVAIATSSTCYMKSYGEVSKIWSPPDLGFGYSNSLFLKDGKLSTIWLQLDADRYLEAKRLLVIKYGPPSTSAVSTVKTKAGAEFPTEDSAWVGKKVTLRLRQRFETADHSLISIEDNDLSAKAEQDFQQKQNAAASKL
jgi:hypothetical protein